MAKNNFNQIRKRVKKPIGSAYGSYEDINKNVQTLKSNLQDRISISRKKSNANKNKIEYGNDASHITNSSEDFYNQVSYNVLEKAAKGHIDKPMHQDYKAILSSEEVLGNKKSLSTVFGSKSGNQSGGTSNAKSRWALPIFIGVVVFLVLGCIVFSNIFGRAYDNKSAVKVVFNEIASIDRDLISLNNILSEDITSDTYNDIEKIKKNLENDHEKLDNLNNRIDSIIADSAAGSDDSNYAPLASEAIYNRQEMINNGIQILDLAIPASSEIEKFDTFWTECQAANQCLEEADDILNDNNPTTVINAQNLSAQAIIHLENATEAINSVSSTDVSTDQYKAYLQAAQKVAEYSLQTCSSMNEDDVEIAADANSKYLDAKSNLADMANSLERGPGQVIRAQYNIQSQPYIEKYKNARNAAAAVDGNIRDYLTR